MLQRTDFEYAALLINNRETTNEEYLLVVDLDSCAAGLCKCNQTGVSLVCHVEQRSFPINEFRSRLMKVDPSGVQTPEHLEGESIYRNYLRQLRLQDASLWNGITCKQLDDLFADCRDSYESLCDQMDQLISDNNVDPDSMRILLIGSMTRNYLANLCIRSHFSFAPLSYDPIFVTIPDVAPNEIVPRGRAIDAEIQMQAPQPFGHSVELILLDVDGREQSFNLAEPDWNIKQSDKSNSSPVFLLSPDEQILLIIDDMRRYIPIPSGAVPKETTAVIASVRVSDTKTTLVLREVKATDTEIASLPISL